MSARLLWALVGIVFVFYAAFRLATLEARIEALSDSVARLEESSVSAIASPGAALLRSLDGGVVSALGVTPSGQSVPHEVERLSAEVARLKGELEKVPVHAEQIVDEVQRKNEEIFARKLEFHRERWLEARSEGMDQFSKEANLLPRQRERMEGVLTDEVDRMMEILRTPEIRDDPARLIEAWDSVLSDTDDQIRRLLAPFQQEHWEKARAFERKTFFPWLPQ